jgi:hypothetical protein
MEWNDSSEKGHSLEPGRTYEARVVEAEERISKKGNPYISLRFEVTLGNGKLIPQFDSIMPAFYPKLKSFCEAAGLTDKMSSRTLEDFHCVGRLVKVVISKQQNDNGYYEIADYKPCGNAGDDPVMNAVKNFEIPADDTPAPENNVRAATSDTPPTDDIPF